MERGTLVRVIRDFLTTTEGELCVSHGEYLQVEEVVDRFWVRCFLEHREGCVPSANVAPVPLPRLTVGQKVCIARYDYADSLPGNVQIRRGDMMITTGEETEDATWLTGDVLSADGQKVRRVVFPGHICWKPEVSRYIQDGSDSGRSLGREVEKYAKVVYSLTAQLEDELTLKVGEIVRITHIIDKDWCRGCVSGRSGIFPSSFVKIIDAFPGDTPTSTSSSLSYLTANNHKDHEYCNTRPAFKGLEDGLRKAFAAPASTSTTTSHGATLHSAININKGCDNSNGLKTSLPTKDFFQRQPTEPSSVLANSAQGYRNLELGMKFAMRGNTLEIPHTSRYENDYEDQINDKEKVRPYALTLYPFCAQFDNELSLSAGDVVFLLRHIDDEWLEGEMDGMQGIFPKSYVRIIKDTSATLEEEEKNSYLRDLQLLNLQVCEDSGTVCLQPGAFHSLLHSFQAEMDSDLTLNEGETVKIVRQTDENWCWVENSSGRSGTCPINHLDPNPRDSHHNKSSDGLFTLGELNSGFPNAPSSSCSGSGLFENPGTLLSLPSLAGSSGLASRKVSTGLKGFDPLCSPDEEIAQLESELISKVLRPPEIPINPEVHIIKNLPLESSEPRPKHRFGRGPSSERRNQNLDSFISENLYSLNSKSRCQSLSSQAVPSNQSVPLSNQHQGFDISSSVLSELRGRRRAPPPPPPSSSEKTTSPEVYDDMENPAYPDVEELYARVDKDRSRSKKRSCVGAQSEAYYSVTGDKCKVDRSSSSSEQGSDYAEVAKTPPICPSRCQSDVYPDDGGSCVLYEELPCNSSITVEAEINQASSTGQVGLQPATSLTAADLTEDGGSTEEKSVGEFRSSRSSEEDWSCESVDGSSRKASVNRYRGLYQEEFPPDKIQEEVEEVDGEDKMPARPSSTPLRSRSVLYNSVLSDRSTPSLPSLSHSYETLNGSDTQETCRIPLRPAPPVPNTASKEQETEKNRTKDRDKKRIRQRRINSLKKKISLKEKLLEDQLILELDMYQDIAVARGSTYDTLNKRMDRCQANIENISNDIQQLQACLAEEECKLEEERIDEITKKEEYDQLQEQMKAKREEEERRKEEARRIKFLEHRDHVIRELMSTEREYCRQLTLTYQAFRVDTPEELEAEGIDVKTLFGNLSDVINVSQTFVERLSSELEFMEDKEDGQPQAEVGFPRSRVGSCFVAEAKRMKLVYTEYCLCQERAEQTLEKYEADPTLHKVIQKGLETLRTDISCFNLASILIKPVQRILKYPLILNELIKVTEVDNPDIQDLRVSLETMSEIASFINETKRKKDIVDKYRAGEDSTLTRRISKLNIHSIGKKSTRISQKLLNSLGFDSLSRDEEFEECERLFSVLNSSVSSLISNLERVIDSIHETAVSQFNTAQNIADLYKDRQPREVEKFLASHSHILSTVWNQFNEYVDTRVLRPLQGLLDSLTGPARLILKRNDKLLDFSSVIQRTEKNKDQSKSKQLNEELETTRTTYLALNSQLVEELPVLLQIGTEMYTECVKQYLQARKIFVGRATKQLLHLMDLPLVTSSSGDILEVFLIKHSLVSNQIGRFSFASKAFRPDDRRGQVSPVPGAAADNHVLQTGNHRTFLRGKYAASKLYQVCEDIVSAGQLDLSARSGDLVGVIQQKDPMGSRTRWFCDNGHTQGFIDSNKLKLVGQSPESGENPKPVEKLSSEIAKPSNNLPGDPAKTLQAKGKLVAVVAPYDEVTEEEGKKPTRPAPPPPSCKVQPQLKKRDPEQISHHSYEEIAASEMQSQINDLSPIYEEIPGGSRSSMSSGSGSGRSSGSPRGRFYYAVYSFSPEPQEKTMIKVEKGQVLRVLQVAGEWWYVQDRFRKRGYVPATYIKPYTS